MTGLKVKHVGCWESLSFSPCSSEAFSSYLLTFLWFTHNNEDITQHWPDLWALHLETFSQCFPGGGSYPHHAEANPAEEWKHADGSCDVLLCGSKCREEGDPLTFSERKAPRVLLCKRRQTALIEWKLKITLMWHLCCSYISWMNTSSSVTLPSRNLRELRVF